MGAAAFLISEFTGVSYFELIKYAALPALVSYVALIYIVHLEVLKLDLKGLPQRPSSLPLARRLGGFLAGFLGLAALSWLVHTVLQWTGDAMPGMTLPTAIALFIGIYIWLVWIASRYPDLEIGLTEDEMKNLPSVGSVAVTGYHFVLPIVVLLWCVLVSRLSPGLSAYWASLAMMFVLLTQHPLKAFFRGTLCDAAFGGR